MGEGDGKEVPFDKVLPFLDQFRIEPFDLTAFAGLSVVSRNVGCLVYNTLVDLLGVEGLEGPPLRTHSHSMENNIYCFCFCLLYFVHTFR